MRLNRTVTSILAMAAVAGLAAAQDASKKKAAPSPAAETSATIGGKSVAIKYSAPSVRGRKIFGADGILKNDPTYPVWRAGANNATALHTDGDLMIGSLSVPKGDYTIYVLPEAAGWKLIVNKQIGQWGTVYQEAQDLGRVPMKMAKTAAPVETMVYTLKASGNKGTLTLEWDTVSASVEITSK
jgi:hypothetical protein